MESKLNAIEPQEVFKYFEALTQIPRESGHEQAVSDYLLKFGQSLGFETIQEPCNNIIIKKPATAGYENAPRVILQGHMDMVCVKKEGYNHDFEKDPIPVVVEGDFIKTEGTTLGADNGIAVAMTMAILASKDLSHPPITALFTVAEETGMDGVVALNPANIEGDILINIDSEEEGVLLASCAGGVNNIIECPISWVKPNKDAAYKITISGLLGGHSGIEINKNRANAIKLAGRVLRAFEGHFDFELFHFEGGEKMNAIAKKARFDLVINQSDEKMLKSLVSHLEKTFKSEYEIADGGISITVDPIEVPEKVFGKAEAHRLIDTLFLIPFGVQAMSSGIEGLVETSNNIGVAEQLENAVKITNAIRSSVKSKKEALNQKMAIISELVGAKNEAVADYPEWSFKVESPIRDLMKEVYKDLFKDELKVDAIHAGLECGFLKEKVGDIDMISLGPNMYDVHTPQERLSIESTARVYNFLKEVLKKIK